MSPPPSRPTGATRARRPDHPRRPARARRRSGLRRGLAVLGFVTLTGLVFVMSFGGGLLSAPFPSDAASPRSGEAYLLASDGTAYAKIKPKETRIPLTDVNTQVSECMRNAIISAEDERFRSHGGVDPLAIVRAAYNDVSGGTTSGASTLTQQYVKNVYTNKERTILRKVKEAALAVRLDDAKTKDQILLLYLNSVYFGNNTYGVQAAAKFYFAVDAKDLTCGQGAMLAGLVSAPSNNNPVRDFGRARSRQRYVLDRMVANGYLTVTRATAELESVTPRSIRHQVNGPAKTSYPEYADLVELAVRKQTESDGTADDLLKNGDVVVRTPLDIDLQKAAQAALQAVLPVDSTALPEAAVVGVNPKTGDVVTVATRQDGGYKRFGFDLGTDIARNSGSTIKPFTLAAALKNNVVTIDQGAYGAPQQNLTVDGCADVFKVKNAEDGEGGYFSYRNALAQSVNTIYAPLAAKVGLAKVKELAVAAGLPPTTRTADTAATLIRGFDGEKAKGTTCPVYPSQSLGVRVSPAELATGYGTLVDGGLHHDRRFVTKIEQSTGAKDDGKGAVVYPVGGRVDDRPKGDRVMSRDVADTVRDAMRGVVTPGGTAAAELGSLPAQLPDLVGKTGTTEGFNNAWFVGCQPELCLAVWMGYEKEFTAAGQPNAMILPGVGQVFGGTLPARIFAQTYTGYLANRAAKGKDPLTSSASPVAVPPPAAVQPSASAPSRRATPSGSALGGFTVPGKGGHRSTPARGSTPARRSTGPAPPSRAGPSSAPSPAPPPASSAAPAPPPAPAPTGTP